jgi:hypothetical protein
MRVQVMVALASAATRLTLDAAQSPINVEFDQAILSGPASILQ